MKMLSTVQASKIINSSVNAIHKWHAQGKIKGKKRVIKKRIVLKLYRDSVLQFAESNKDSKRIGRELFCREVQRKPHKCRGYVLIYKPEHDRAYHNGYVPEHVLQAEIKLGRPLTKKEVVHHINGKRDDNTLENLKVYESQSAHMKEAHNLLKEFLSSPIQN